MFSVTFCNLRFLIFTNKQPTQSRVRIILPSLDCFNIICLFTFRFYYINSMAKLSPHLLNVVHKIVAIYIGKRRKSRNNCLFYKNLSSLGILKKYKKLQGLLNQKRIFFMKSLINIGYFPHRYRYSNWWDKINKFTDVQWIKYLRMRRQTFALLVSQITPILQQQSNQTFPMSFEKQIALTLISLSSGKSNKYLGRLFSLSDIQRIIENTCVAIIHLMPNYVRIPNKEEMKDNVLEFEKKWGFPQCAGVLGSMHIPLKRSQLPDNLTDYMNTNFDYTVLFQGIVDANYKFWDINVGWPGSVPECRILTNSTIWLKGQDRKLFLESIQVRQDIPMYILAGASYPLTHWVLKPFLNEPASKKETVFNEKFRFAYNACEIALKRLKARWQCLVSRNIVSIEALPTSVSACCVLHNMCEMYGEPILDKWMAKAESHFKQPIPSVCSTVIGLQAESIRSAVSSYLMKTDVNNK